jgi:hypothetical protein
VQVHLAAAGSGALYNSFWWGATLTCLRQCFLPDLPWRNRKGGFFHILALM